MGSMPLRKRLQLDITLTDSTTLGDKFSNQPMHCPAVPSSLLVISLLQRRILQVVSLKSRHATSAAFSG